MTPSVLGPGAREILWAPFKTGVSFPTDLWISRKEAPLAFKSQAFLVLVFPMQDPTAREPDVELRSLIP